MYRQAAWVTGPPDGTSTGPRSRGGETTGGVSRSRRPRSAAPRPGGFRSWLGHGRFGLVRLLVRRLAHGGRHLLLRWPLAQEPDRQRGQRTERGAEEEAERPVELRRAV